MTMVATATQASEVSEYEAYRRRKHFALLDGVRCLSIVAVVWHHTKGPSDIALLNRGFLGVDMFFVLSGFLIVTLLLREADSRGSISLTRFYARRTLRIFPVYYATVGTLAFYYLLKDAADEGGKHFLNALPYYLTYTINWLVLPAGLLGVAWSLAAEEQFYVVWPPLQKWCGKRLLAIGLLAFIVLNQLVNFRLLDNWMDTALGVRHADLHILQITFTPICLGVLLAMMLHEARGFRLVQAVVAGKAGALLWGTVIVVLCTYQGDVAGWPRLSIQLAMALFLASCVIEERNWLTPVLASRPARRIGMISYGMYLFHMLVRHFVVTGLVAVGLAPRGVILFLGCLVSTIVVAELSYRYFESPILRIKTRFQSL